MDLLTSDTSSAATGGSSAAGGAAADSQSSAARRRARAELPPPGDTGTHWTRPNKYLLEAARRANVVISRRHPLEENGESLAVALQRYVHFEGNRPPVRQILLHLRLLALYPPIPDVLPDLVLLLEFESVHICRLAHYHVRAAAPIVDAGLYRELMDALTREVGRASPARRAAATKTMAKVFVPKDVDRAIDFVTDVFNRIGGARVIEPTASVQRRKVAGVVIPGTDVSGKEGVDEKNKATAKTKKDKNSSESSGIGARLKARPAVLGGGSALRSGVEVAPDVDDGVLVAGGSGSSNPNLSAYMDDDGAGGAMSPNSRAMAGYIKTRFGKMLVGHAVLAALRRINRVASEKCTVEAFFFDSGLMSIVPSTVRHTVALLEIRSVQSPVQVSKYIAPRLPHRNPPANKKLVLEDLGAKIYFARMLGALAEDPNLIAHIPDTAPQQARNANDRRRGRSAGPKTGLGSSSAAEARAQALAGENVKEKAGSLFKFLFHRDRVSEISSSVKSSSSAIVAATAGSRSSAPQKVEDPRGVEFAEALVNLLKNASNRVLLEALRGLSHRRWTTWFEAPIPQSSLYNSPELVDPNAVEGNEGRWGIEDDLDDDDGDEEDDRDGAFEDDIADEAEAEAAANAAAAASGSGGVAAAASGKLAKEALDPDLVDTDTGGEKKTWLSGTKLKRKERRDARFDSKTPFYLRRVGAGMVPALEVILRRVFHAMLHDESIRRFAAVDAVIVLARAKLYGHSLTDQQRLQKAKQATAQPRNVFISRAVPSSSTALIVQDSGTDSGDDHPFEPLVATLKELMDEDPNRYVRGRAAIALAFVLASGAGRKHLEVQSGSRDVDEDDTITSAIMVRYFRSFVVREGAGRGTGLRLVSELIDYLVYELLDLAPELSPSAVELAELWAVTHPTIGVCGRLGALWEKVLSLGAGQVVGASIFRAMAVQPHAERVASAAAAFLRRRTLDLAVLTVGTTHLAGSGVPEPLPRAISMEMEKYFSLLWHSALLGPSAECRTLSIEALGGAAALAGDPLRVSTYERLVELVRVRGLGLKIAAENVMDALDVLYFCRERFSEARYENQIARDGSNRSTAWLQIVWRLSAESSSAAQVLLGAPPPTGWQPLGPGGAADVSNAEAKFGDVRDRQAAEKLKDASVARQAAPSETPVLAIEDLAVPADSTDGSSGAKVGSASSVFAYAPKGFEAGGAVGGGGTRGRRGNYSDDEDSLDDHFTRDRRASPSPEKGGRGGPSGASGRRRDSLSDNGDAYDDIDDDDGYYRARSGTRGSRKVSRDSDGPGAADGGRPRGGVDEDGEEEWSGSGSRSFRRRRSHGAGSRFDMSGVREDLEGAGRRATDFAARMEQEARDHELAKRLQKEEKGGRRMFGETQVASKLLKTSLKSGSGAASKAGKLAKSLGGKGGGPS